MAEKDYFLVKANRDHVSFVIDEESRADAIYKVTITKGKIYKAYNYYTSTFYVIGKDDINRAHIRYVVSIFDKLEFIDIWKLKRNGKSILSYM